MTKSERNPKSEIRMTLCRRGAFRALGLIRHSTFDIRHLAVAFVCVSAPAFASEAIHVLRPASFAHHIEHFNAMEDENWTNFVSNAHSWEWLQANIPFFECPDREVEEIYYYRWWSFRKHLVQTTNGFVFTEFLMPMRHAGVFNTISCAVGHHLAEGRWLREQKYLDDYVRFWLRGNGGKPQPHFHKYSSWFAAAVYERCLVNHDRKFVTSLLPDLVTDYHVWEQERRATNGLFWQFDVQDGMEESISGSRTVRNLRPTINSYMFANARAISSIAQLAGNKKLVAEFASRASELQRLTQEQLWNPAANFFEARRPDGAFADVREELGFVPWCFKLPAPGFEAAWAHLTDPAGFRSTYGIATAERRHPGFRTHGCCKCEWDGAVWPFATSQTLTALANVLRDYAPSCVSNRDYFDNFMAYVRCQRFDGKPYLGEYLDETTGQWLKGRQERSRYYNHSTFADLVITGVVGLRPQDTDEVEVQPLLPDAIWDWFCLDGVKYHGKVLTIIWDRDGSRYHRSPGLSILADGKPLGQRKDLGKLNVRVR